MAAVDPHADAIRRNGVGQDVAQPVRVLQQRLVGGDGAQQLVRNVARPPLELDDQLPLPAFEPHREHLREQFRHRSPLERDDARRIMVAGEEAPEPPLDDDRDRHRGLDAHVLEIFDVDRRHGAQHREREIERRPVLVQHRHDPDRLRVHVGDDPEQVALVERARLHGDVRRWIVQPEERADSAPAGFGGNLARAVGGEAVHHDPVVAGERAKLPRALVQEIGNGRHLVQARDHRSDGPGRIARVPRSGLRLDDDLAAGDMDGDVERIAVLADRASEQSFHRVRAAQHGDAVAQGMDRARRKQPGQGPPKQCLAVAGADEGARIVGHPGDHPV